MRAYQVEDTRTLLEKPAFGLWLDCRLGKTKIVIDAACELYKRGDIDAVIVVCPANVRSVWSDRDPALGEVSKWATEPFEVREYRSTRDLRSWSSDHLSWSITNPEFIRRDGRLKPLLEWAKTRKVLLVGDESWMWANPRAAQTKAMIKLRQHCARAVLLNGTPGAPDKLYSQFYILDSGIWDGMRWFAWRNKFCKMGGFQLKQIVGFRNEEEFHRRTAPFCRVRKAREHLDLGSPPVYTQIDAKLTPATWKAYCDMRDECVAWLSTSEASIAGQAGVKVLRLAQVANGFLGGVTDLDRPDQPQVRALSDEKLRAMIDWLNTYWTDDKLVIWTRFRADVERTARVLGQVYPGHEVVKLYGGQSADDRRRAKELLAPDGAPQPAIVVGNAQSGGSGLNFSAASTTVYLANDYSLTTRLQSEARVVGPASAGKLTYLDVVATGPDGQRTVDHQVVAALRKHENIAAWTASIWQQKLQEAA